MKLLESGEMYLETILVLSKKIKNVHSIDIAKELNFSKPSVSRAVNKLKDYNYINIDTNGVITLADSGKEIAEKIYERHNVLSKLLVSMGVDEDIAAEDACRMEHVISDDSFNAIKKHFNF